MCKLDEYKIRIFIRTILTLEIFYPDSTLTANILDFLFFYARIVFDAQVSGLGTGSRKTQRW
jgi:hypothetical protein